MEWSTLPSECRERKVRYLAPWGGTGGEASWVHPLPWGVDTFHFTPTDPILALVNQQVV